MKTRASFKEVTKHKTNPPPCHFQKQSRKGAKTVNKTVISGALNLEKQVAIMEGKQLYKFKTLF